MSEWQDISTAPKDGTEVLVWVPEWDEMYLGWCSDGHWSLSDGWECSIDGAPYPTHWMPLPAPPDSTDT